MYTYLILINAISLSPDSQTHNSAGERLGCVAKFPIQAHCFVKRSNNGSDDVVALISSTSL